jgi:nicotinate-nucleotide pyrophosphorylase (carboxylating)
MEEYLRNRIRESLEEDVGAGDFTSLWTLPLDLRGGAKIVAKQDAVISGIEALRTVFEEVDKEIQVRILHGDGESVSSGEVIARISGSVRGLLTGERTALNFLAHLSGVATLTRKFVDQVKDLGTKILGTRKTTPLWRSLERAAIRHGGGFDHRFGLFDQILIKDNHIDAAGGIREAIRAAKSQNALNLLLEVEARNLDEVRDALEESPDIILLDNMSVEDIRQAVSICDGIVESEASGGITLENVRAVAETGVNRISIGALTHSAPSIDFTMLMER